MKSYARRLFKFFLFLIVLFFIMLFLLPWLTKGVSFEQSWYIIAGNQKMRIILIALFAYSLIYPLINFGKRDRFVSGSFADNRSAIEEAMEESDYVKKGDDGSTLVYRRKSKFAGILMFGEDRVEIDTTKKPLVFRGPKKDLKRIDIALYAKLLGKKE